MFVPLQRGSRRRRESGGESCICWRFRLVAALPPDSCVLPASAKLDIDNAPLVGTAPEPPCAQFQVLRRLESNWMELSGLRSIAAD